MNSIHHPIRSLVLVAGGLLASVCWLHADVVVRNHTVNLYRAQDLLGMRVMSADGHRVGAISDFVFDFHGRPRLTDVIVTSGPLGWLGKSRMIPIAALRQQGDHCQENLSRTKFSSIPPLSIYDVDHYLAQRRDLTALDREFHVPARPPQGQFVTYTSLLNTRLIGSDGAQIGFVTDALVTLNQHEVFYLGVVPTYNVFESDNGTRLEIPASTVARDYDGEIHLSIPCNDRVVDAPYVTSLRNLTASDSRLGQVFRLNFS